MKSQPSTAEHAILSTLAYFDLFSFPLTPFEIWKWLYVKPGENPISLPEVLLLLRESSYLHDRVEMEEGFVVLRGKRKIIPVRKERYLIAEQKYQRLRDSLARLRWVPFIKTIAVCNNLAYNNSQREGDLDVLILTEPGHIWTTRFLSVGLAELFRLRPDEQGRQDKLCLSFFLSATTVDLRPLLMKPDDPYLHYWIDHLVPVYGDVSAIDTLREANRWYRDRLPNALGTWPARRRLLPSSVSSNIIRRILRILHSGALGRVLEQWYRLIQIRFLPNGLRSLANRDSRVMMNDAMLKFHENDRRQEFVAQHAIRLQEVQ